MEIISTESTGKIGPTYRLKISNKWFKKLLSILKSSIQEPNILWSSLCS